MQLKSDIVIEAAKFDPANNSEQANKLNQSLIAVAEKGPQWWEVCIHGPLSVVYVDWLIVC
jgi:hypothetical protein